LYNHSPLAADISGCVLTDDPGVPKFVIPTNTIVSAGNFSHFRQGTLGFTLPMTGGRVFLINPAHNRILDTVQFEGQEKNISTGRRTMVPAQHQHSRTAECLSAGGPTGDQ
jgi:hypothetical protein